MDELVQVVITKLGPDEFKVTTFNKKTTTGSTLASHADVLILVDFDLERMKVIDE